MFLENITEIKRKLINFQIVLNHLLYDNIAPTFIDIDPSSQIICLVNPVLFGIIFLQLFHEPKIWMIRLEVIQPVGLLPVWPIWQRRRGRVRCKRNSVTISIGFILTGLITYN